MNCRRARRMSRLWGVVVPPSEMKELRLLGWEPSCVGQEGAPGHGIQVVAMHSCLPKEWMNSRCLCEQVRPVCPCAPGAAWFIFQKVLWKMDVGCGFSSCSVIPAQCMVWLSLACSSGKSDLMGRVLNRPWSFQECSLYRIISTWVWYVW